MAPGNAADLPRSALVKLPNPRGKSSWPSTKHHSWIYVISHADRSMETCSHPRRPPRQRPHQDPRNWTTCNSATRTPKTNCAPASPHAPAAAASGRPGRFHRARAPHGGPALSPARRLARRRAAGAGRLPAGREPHLRQLPVCGRPGDPRVQPWPQPGRPAARRADGIGATRRLRQTGAGYRPVERAGPALLFPPGPADQRHALLKPLEQETPR